MKCKMKKKTMWVFVFQKYGKFRNVSLEHFIKHKPLISEECRLRQLVRAVPSIKSKEIGHKKDQPNPNSEGVQIKS